ncbi:MAG: hypothetical protein J0H74_24905 [Chitinophagaceae bacterium]|nr:hypothetical protein [Chitinophagaceae bacterium]
MKIVQSFWSKPGKKGDGFNNFGWPDRKFNFFAWTLSLLQFRKYYPEVELVTDKEGYNLLVEKLELPYTSTRVCLDELNDYHPELFALGKIYAYRLQEHPFIHVDNDVFIWEKFSDQLVSAALIGQNLEDGDLYNRFYRMIFFELVDKIGYYPDVLNDSLDRNHRILAVNAGILGGTSMDFFKLYTREAFEFVDKVSSKINRINVKDFNTIFEQVLFHALAEKKNLKIGYYRKEPIRYRFDIADFTLVPSRTKYIHLIGAFKKNRAVLQQLEYRLMTDYPDNYYKILDLIRKNHI